MTELVGSLLSDHAEERLDLLFRAANDAFFDVDVERRTISWSPGIRLLFGHDPAVLGPDLDAWQRLAHPDEVPGLVASGRHAITEGTTDRKSVV